MSSKVKLISEKLNLDQQQALEFIEKVRQQAGYPVKHRDILKALNKLNPQNDDLVLQIVRYVEGDFKSSSSLGSRLGLKEREVGRLHQKINQELGYNLREGEILSILDEIDRYQKAVTFRKKIILNSLNEVKAEELTKSWGLQSHDLTLILPNYDEHEIWVDNKYLIDKVNRFPDSGCVPKVQDLLDLSYQCSVEIIEKRRYQIPSQGRAEIMASDRLTEVLGLKSIRFLQEGIKAPQVFLRFNFGTPAKVGILRVDKDGSTIGFHTELNTEVVKILVEAIALAYYRDLVVPSGVYYYSPNKQFRQPKKIRSSRSHNSRYLPHSQRIQITEQDTPIYDLRDWYSAQERERHNVVGHIRWVDNNFVASAEKRQQAEEAAGIQLPKGYTWVIEHERGNAIIRDLKLLGTDLMKHTLFLPPKRASKDLNILL